MKSILRTGYTKLYKKDSLKRSWQFWDTIQTNSCLLEHTRVIQIKKIKAVHHHLLQST